MFHSRAAGGRRRRGCGLGSSPARCRRPQALHRHRSDQHEQADAEGIARTAPTGCAAIRSGRAGRRGLDGRDGLGGDDDVGAEHSGRGVDADCRGRRKPRGHREPHQVAAAQRRSPAGRTRRPPARAAPRRPPRRSRRRPSTSTGYGLPVGDRGHDGERHARGVQAGDERRWPAHRRHRVRRCRARRCVDPPSRAAAPARPGPGPPMSPARRAVARWSGRAALPSGPAAAATTPPAGWRRRPERSGSTGTAPGETSRCRGHPPKVRADRPRDASSTKLSASSSDRTGPTWPDCGYSAHVHGERLRRDRTLLHAGQIDDQGDLPVHDPRAHRGDLRLGRFRPRAPSSSAMITMRETSAERVSGARADQARSALVDDRIVPPGCFRYAISAARSPLWD